MSGQSLRLTAALLAMCGTSAQLRAQSAEPARTGVQVAPAFIQWTFKTPLVQDRVRIKSATQMALPLSVFVPIGSRWAIDVAGAYTVGHVAVESADSSNSARSVSLNGPTDIKVRLVGRAKGDHVRMTFGVNVPTGTTGLDEDQLLATRVIGAPALRAPIPTLGSGLGATAGIVFATQAGDWAYALGTSYELRGSYSPIEASIAGVSSAIDLDPANAVHVTAGADRLIGPHRLSMLVVTDFFTADHVSLGGASANSVNSQYTMGPSVTALAALELGVVGFREFTVSLSNRYRSAFKGTDGEKAAGSSGNFLDAQLRAITGAPDRFGWVFGADARVDSGMEVDNSLATAAITAAGVTFGATIPSSTFSTQPFVRVMFGSMNTGIGTSKITSLSAGVSINRH